MVSRQDFAARRHNPDPLVLRLLLLNRPEEVAARALGLSDLVEVDCNRDKVIANLLDNTLLG
jgi:hypothetical protein